MKRKSNYVQCFYCEDMLNRPQGRAAHIRKAHPGAPYQPTPEQIAKYRASLTGKPAATFQTAPPSAPAHLSPREHLVAAISEIRDRLDLTHRQIPALETQLQDLRTSQGRMEQDLSALDTALAAIDGASQTQLQLEPEAQPLVVQSESPAPAEPPAVQPSLRHARLVARGARA